MQRAGLLCFGFSWAACGLVAACEADTREARIETAVFAPGPGGSSTGAGAGGSGVRDSGGGEGGSCAISGCGGDAGQTGAGGQSGASGSGARPAGPLCAEACKVDADCESLLPNQEFLCNPETQRCEGFASPCRSDAECIPGASQWLWNCSSDQDCYFFDDDVCVNVAGAGRCARIAPAPEISGGGCVFPAPDAVVLPRLGAAGTALVCSDSSQRCRAGICTPICRGQEDCYSDTNGSICDVQTGMCACERDSDCRMPGVSRCNTAARRCECSDDGDCEGVPNTDKCIDGHCGCGSQAACTAERFFTGTRYVCE
jgi:hypothetical protein